ncbi:FAD-dependent monooxygenase [Mycobacterium sp. pUA109]|uniref:FAD-dependent monooxygenase n=1 Tax=Mycobacterium sp. pUA109 TaxID=3238982 RepID=UPI00351B8CE6
MARLDIIGGGPAGAFTARLAALRYPDWKIRLFEHLPPHDTFGFGVGLTRALLKAVDDADPTIHRRLRAATFPFSSAEFHLPQGTVNFGRSHTGAIRRAELLRILLEGAEEAGAEVRIGAPAHVDDLRGNADIVVGADGLSSSTRSRFLPQFNASTTMGRGVFIWCAADIELSGSVFEPVETPAGIFVAHAYPYAQGLSTFVIETSSETIRRAGFTDHEWKSDDESDDRALEYLSDAYSTMLKGAHFFGNRSRWSHFTTLKCQNWSYQNVVLLGDAAATVHPSLGSGTKVALESAIALVESLAALETRPPGRVLQEFVRTRRPSVARLQERAMRSQLWWESFPARKDLSPSRIALAYLSRSGVVSLDGLAASDLELAVQATADFANVPAAAVPVRELSQWVLHHAFSNHKLKLPTRVLPPADGSASNGTVMTIDVANGDAWGPDGDDYVQRAKEHARSGAHIVALTGGTGRSDLMDRLAVAERIRSETDCAVAIRARADQQDLVADGIVADRADLLELDVSS